MLYQDNTSTIARLANPTAIGMIKDIDARDKYVIQLVRDGRARVFYLPTMDMIADPLTKPLDTIHFLRHREALLMSTRDVTNGIERKLTDCEKRATETAANYITLCDLQAGLTKIFDRLQKVNIYPSITWGGGVLGESTGDARVECGGQLRGQRIHTVEDEVQYRTGHKGETWGHN